MRTLRPTLFIMLLAACLLSSAAPASALSLLPGSPAVATDSGSNTDPTRTAPVMGTKLAEISMNNFSSNPLSFMWYRATVWSDPDNPYGAGRLTFLYDFRLNIPSQEVLRAEASSFTGFQTDVGRLIAGLSWAPSSIERPDDAHVWFNFEHGLDAGMASDIFVVRTDAMNFGPGTLRLTGGAVGAADFSVDLNGYAPMSGEAAVPEPGSLLLLASGIAAGAAWRKRR